MWRNVFGAEVDDGHVGEEAGRVGDLDLDGQHERDVLASMLVVVRLVGHVVGLGREEALVHARLVVHKAHDRDRLRLVRMHSLQHKTKMYWLI